MTDTATPSASTGDEIFDALNPQGRRRRASRQSRRPEDLLLTERRRDDLDANAYDLYRNLVTLRWMVRQTLNFVCTMDIQYKFEDDGFNRALRERMETSCKDADETHSVGRMDWDDIRRSQEGGKITTGDSFIVPLREGTLQPVEGTYCRSPQVGSNGGRWRNGARLNKRDRVLDWNFRTESLHGLPGNKQDQKVSARNVWQHVQYDDTRSNQVRGVAEIISVINGLRDVGEGFDLNLVKLKVEAMLGVHIKRRPGEHSDLGKAVGADGQKTDDDDETDDDLHMDFGRGPVVIDREDIEEVNLLMSKSPPQASQDFLRLCLLVGLMALDLPYNFLDSGHANFFGNQAAWNLYERSCVFRRKPQFRLHKRMTDWRHLQWFMPKSLGGTGEFTLPRGMTSVRQIPYVWIPRGIPWWRPKEGLETDMMAVALGWKTNQNVCDERDLGSYEDNLRQLEREALMRERHGFSLNQNINKLGASLQPAGKKGDRDDLV